MAKLWETWKQKAESAEFALVQERRQHNEKANTLQHRIAELEEQIEGDRSSFGQQIRSLTQDLDAAVKAKTQLEAKQHAIATLLSSPT